MNIKNKYYLKDENLKKLAQEVIDFIKQTVGVEEFSLVYSIANKRRVENKEERKRKLAQTLNNFLIKKRIFFKYLTILFTNRLYWILNWLRLRKYAKCNVKRKLKNEN